MPKPTITHPAIIDKKDIATCALLYGKANSTSMKVGGKQYKARELLYVTFAGAVDLKDKKYHGEHRFEVGDFSKSEAADMSSIPGMGGKSYGI